MTTNPPTGRSDEDLCPALKAAEAVCHDEQLEIWADEFLEHFGLTGFLNLPETYEEKLELGDYVKAAIKDLVEKAFDHPELTNSEVGAQLRQGSEPATAKAKATEADGPTRPSSASTLDIEELRRGLPEGPWSWHRGLASERYYVDAGDLPICDVANIEAAEPVARAIASTPDLLAEIEKQARVIAQIQPPFDIGDNMTVELAVKCGALEAELDRLLALTVRELNAAADRKRACNCDECCECRSERQHKAACALERMAREIEIRKSGKSRRIAALEAENERLKNLTVAAPLSEREATILHQLEERGDRIRELEAENGKFQTERQFAIDWMNEIRRACHDATGGNATFIDNDVTQAIRHLMAERDATRSLYEEMREALKPLVAHADYLTSYYSAEELAEIDQEHHLVAHSITVAACFKARATLTKTQQAEEAHEK